MFAFNNAFLVFPKIIDRQAPTLLVELKIYFEDFLKVYHSG